MSGNAVDAVIAMEQRILVACGVTELRRSLLAPR